MAIIVRRTETLRDYAECVVIRYRVFVLTQNVPGDVEIDTYEDTSVHYLALEEKKPVGTARYRLLGNDTAKIERMAVLPEHQGTGAGTALVERVVNDLKALGTIATIKASGQTHALGFYERSGFQVVGPEYLDAGIPHRDIFMPVGG
jgi:predicted GNAT family N-acyltransferase